MRILALLTVIAIILISSFSLAKEPVHYSLKDGIHIVKIKADYFYKNSDIYVSDETETIKSASENIKPKIIVNAGFFDPINKQTVSYVRKNSKVILDPEENKNLTDNENLKPYLFKIFNRPELRLLSSGEKLKLDIKPHKFSVPKNYKIRYSIQAGPTLLPEIKLEREFFIIKEGKKIKSQSAKVLNKEARTAVGFDRDFVYILMVPKEKGKKIKELSEFMKKMKIEKAIAFDGGSSSSMCIQSDKEFKCFNYKKDSDFRKVKSFLYVK